KTRASLLDKIVGHDAPMVSHVRPNIPVSLDRIVNTCLAKDPDERYQSARDLLRDLRWVASGTGDHAAARPIAPPERSNRAVWLPEILASIGMTAPAILTLRLGSEEVPPTTRGVKFTISSPENPWLGGPLGGGTGAATQVAVSPDGRNIVFLAGTTS